MNTRIVAGLICSVPITLAAQTPAPPALPPVVVTAEEQSLIDQPEAVSRITGDQLRDRDLGSLTDLQSLAPNFITRSGGSRSLNNVIGFRGLVNNPFFGEPAVALYVDDVPYGSTLTYDTIFLNADHIDLYRGPQFTRWGRRGAAGLISVHSREPGDRYRFEGIAGFASHDEQYFKLALDGPLGPNFGFSLSGMYSRRDGYLHNGLLHVRPDYQDQLAGRFALHWNPTDRLHIQFTVSGQRFDDGAQLSLTRTPLRMRSSTVLPE